MCRVDLLQPALPDCFFTTHLNESHISPNKDRGARVVCDPSNDSVQPKRPPYCAILKNACDKFQYWWKKKKTVAYYRSPPQ